MKHISRCSNVCASVCAYVTIVCCCYDICPIVSSSSFQPKLLEFNMLIAACPLLAPQIVPCLLIERHFGVLP